MYGMASHIQEGFSYMGMLPICVKPAHVSEAFSYMGRLPIFGKTFHTLGRLPINGMDEQLVLPM
jgi:hypothetical protein